MTDNRFTKYDPCKRCGFKYGFHICLDRTKAQLQRVVLAKGEKKPVVDPEEKRREAEERALARYNERRAETAERDAAIVERYKEGGVGYVILCTEFHTSYSVVRQVLREAADRGEITLRRSGQKAT